MKVPYSHTQTAHVSSSFHETLLTDYVRQIVYGASDGVVPTFAVIAGFSGANQSANSVVLATSVVILISVASLFADAVSMGLGDYLSSEAEQDVYESLIEYENTQLQINEKAMLHKTHDILVGKGFSQPDASTILSIFKKNHSFWIDWIVHEQTGVPDPGSSISWIAAITTSISFLTFGSIPLALFWLYQGDSTTAFLASLLGVVVCWIIIAYLRWAAAGQRFTKAFIETFFVGAISAGVAFMVGTLIG